MKFVIALVLLTLVSVGGYFGYEKYQEHNFIGATTPLVKNSSLRLQNCLRYETEPLDGLTYKEFFDKILESISEVEKNILAVQTIATEKQKKRSDLIVAYLKGVQEIQRALLSKYRKELALNSALERAVNSMKDLTTSNSYSVDMSTKILIETMEDTEKARQESQKAVSNLVKATEKMKELTASVAKIFPTSAIIENAMLDAVQKKNETDEVKPEGQK